MRNITAEANATKNMPSTSEFTSAKLQESFDFMGSKLSNCLFQMNLKKEIFTTEAKLNSSLAKDIGRTVIEQIQNNQDPHIPYEMIRKVVELTQKIENLKKMEGAHTRDFSRE